MLLSFSVTNYKSIKDQQTLSMVGTHLKGPREPMAARYPGGGEGVLPCAIIYGANASGKSNIIDAFQRMRGMILHSHTEASKGRKFKRHAFLLDEHCKSIPTEFEVSFLTNGVRYDYGFSFDDERIIEEWLFSFPEGRRRKLFERTGLDISFGAGLRGAKKVLASFLKETTLFLTIAVHTDHEDLISVIDFFHNI